MYLHLQAAQTLVSHLRAQGYEASADSDNVTITLPRRQERLTVGFDYGPRQVSSLDLRSANPDAIQKALDHVRRVARLRSRPISVYRDVEQRRNTLEDDFDDVLFRSKALARCPNPSHADMQHYAPLVKRISKSVWSRFRKPLLAFGFESEDMESYGLVHLTTALHRYRIGKASYDEAVVGRYVTQRLMEIVRKVKRKALQCSADSEVRSFVELRNV